MLLKKSVLKNLAIFLGKNLCWRTSLINLQEQRPEFSLKKRLQTRCFPVNIARFLKRAFL